MLRESGCINYNIIYFLGKHLKNFFRINYNLSIVVVGINTDSSLNMLSIGKTDLTVPIVFIYVRFRTLKTTSCIQVLFIGGILLLHLTTDPKHEKLQCFLQCRSNPYRVLEDLRSSHVGGISV